MALAAGRLRHRVTFQRFAELLDSNGEVIQDPESGEIARAWVDVVTAWTAIEPLSGREFIASQAVQSKISGKFVNREPAVRDVDAACRGLHNGKIYQIEAKLPDPESGLEYVSMPFSQGVNDGQ